MAVESSGQAMQNTQGHLITKRCMILGLKIVQDVGVEHDPMYELCGL